MEYNTIKIPNSLNKEHEKMTPDEVDEYLKWFLSIKDERLDYLVRTVFNISDPLFSDNSLQTLQYFLKENIAVQPRSNSEIEAIRKSLPKHIQSVHKIPDYILVEPTISISIDIGIFFSEYLRNEVKGIEWAAEKEPTDIHYGRPVLVKEGIGSRFCPSWIMGTVVEQVYENRIKEDRLVDLFNTWKSNYLGIKKDYRALVDSWANKKKKK